MDRIVARLAFALAITAFAFPALALTAAAQEAPKILAFAPVQTLVNQNDRFVAGKETVILVLMDAPVASDATTQKVVLKLGGATVASLAPLPSPEPRSILEFSCASMAECGGWKAGDYTFEITVGAAMMTGTRTFKDRGVVNVLVMPMKQNYGAGDVRSVPNDSWKKMGDFTRRVFPLAPENLKWTIGPELDLSADKFNIRSSEGMNEVAMALMGLQAPECQQAPPPSNVTCYKKIMGFVRDRHGPEGTTQGYALGFANVVTVTDEDAPATVAHEIAHGFELGDEYVGGSYHCKNNPTPPDYVGKDWFDRANTKFSCTSSSRVGFTFGGSGSTVLPPFVDGKLVLGNEGGYEVGGRRGLHAMVSFMGSGSKQEHAWITRDIWTRLFDAFDPVAKAASVEPQATASVRLVSFAGEIDSKDKIFLQPWNSFTSKTPVADTTGALFVRAVDTAGKALATTAIKFDAQVAEPIPGFDKSDFRGTVSYPAGTAKFEVVRGTTVLASVMASANAPVVTVTSPKAGDAPTGPAKVAWTATDADGDKVLARVEYSPNNGGQWFQLEPDLDKNEVTIDFSQLPGTGKAEAIIRVTATDGINATAATSGLFTVTQKPLVALLDMPEYIETEKGNPVFFLGIGLDPMDGFVAAADKLSWTSDRDGPLGKGDLIETAKLSQGTHTVTLGVTNSQGKTAAATVTVVVHPAGRKVAVADVYSVYDLYLGRSPSFPTEVVGWLGHDFGDLVEQVSASLEAELWLDAGHAIEAKSPYTGLAIKQ